MPEPQLSVVKSEPLTVVASGPTEGYWEDRGIAGQMWHPPGVPLGRDPSSQRADVNVASGLPFIDTLSPEGLLGGIAAVRAIGGAVVGTQLGAAQRALAGLQATLTQAAPVVKYEVTKTVLEHIGVPTPVAVILATGASGYQRGRGAAAAEPRPAPALESVPTPPRPVGTSTAWTPGVLPRAPAPISEPTSVSVPPISEPTSVSVPPAAGVARRASAPAALGLPTEPVTPRSAPISPTPSESPGFGWSPQRIRNEVSLAARRMKVTLTEPQVQAAEDLVRAGKVPTAAVAQAAPAKVAAAPEGTPPPAAKPKVLAAEMKEYSRLRRMGISHEKAVEVLQAQREFARRFGTPSTEEMRRTIAERNQSGEWPE
jgi:hypothetical protein